MPVGAGVQHAEGRGRHRPQLLGGQPGAVARRHVPRVPGVELRRAGRGHRHGRRRLHAPAPGLTSLTSATSRPEPHPARHALPPAAAPFRYSVFPLPSDVAWSK